MSRNMKKYRQPLLNSKINNLLKSAIIEINLPSSFTSISFSDSPLLINLSSLFNNKPVHVLVEIRKYRPCATIYNKTVTLGTW